MKIELLSIIIMLLFLQCKKSDDEKLGIAKVPISITRTIDGDSEALLFTYDEDNYLTKFVIDHSGVGYQIVYDGNAPTTLQEVEDGTVWNQYDIIWDGQNITSFNVAGEDEIFISCEYSSGKLSKLTNPQKENNFLWNAENVKSIATKEESGDRLFQDTKTYNYCSYVHPLTNIDLPFAVKFLIGNRAYDFLSFFDYLGYGENVVTSMSISANFTLDVPENTNFLVEADEDGYPTYLISDDGNIIFEIHYKEI